MTFHWFLPTSGDGDQSVPPPSPRGRKARPGRDGRPTWPRSAGPPRRRVHRRAHAGGRRLPRPVDRLRGGGPAHRAARHAGRGPGRFRAAHPHRPAGRGVPVRLRRSARRSTSSPAATRPSSAPTATSSTTTPDTPAPRSSSRCSAARGVGGPFDFAGEHYRVDRRGPGRPAGRRRRRSTSAARPRPPRRWLPGRPTRTSCGVSRRPSIAARVARVRALAAEQGRTLRTGLRLHVIARPTARRRVGRGRPAARRDEPGADRRRPGPLPPGWTRSARPGWPR